MVLPMNYAEIEQEEMMYLDGGFDAKSFVYGALATAILAVQPAGCARPQ